MNSVIASRILYFTTAKEIWDDLLMRYSKSHAPKIFHITQDIANCVQGLVLILLNLEGCGMNILA